MAELTETEATSHEETVPRDRPDVVALEVSRRGIVTEPEAPPQAAEKAEEQQSAVAAGEVAPNYRYWREHGGEWVAEYNRRKKTLVYYHIQEIMLSEYVAAHAPSKVLEFGCGVGRHLRNLTGIPDVEVYGYDQSAAMAAGCRTWAAEDWLRDHVTVGAPTGRLPYDDGAFDIVYTSEVLIHVHPGDLQGILKELLRVSRRQVFHLEPAEHIPINDGDHDGCWKHDFVAAYARLGLRCEILPSGYSQHAPYRVWKPGAEPPVNEQWRWSPVTLSLYRRLVSDLSTGLSSMQAEREAMQGQLSALAEAQEGRRAATQRGEALAAQVTEAQARIRELESRLAAAAQEVAQAQQEREHFRTEAEQSATRVRAEQGAFRERTEDLTRRLAIERERAQSLQEAYERLKDAIVTETAHG